ncbi:hypothetical protein [Nocardiopsis dassonvillei]|uniref:hypothetical protein n=1 Tax=Nocardiopsis dassonvillei TaxID=2014 RepID=UPI003624D67D
MTSDQALNADEILDRAGVPNPAPADEWGAGTVDEHGRRRPPGMLPEELWNASPVLRHIRQAAHARCCSGDVVLHGTLSRLSGMISHNLRAETGVGSSASLNLFSAAVGPTGAGKTSAMGVVRELLSPPADKDFKDFMPLGSGEGFAEVYMGTVEEPTGDIHRAGKSKGDPILVKVRRQVRHRSFFYCDEGETLTKLLERNGSTIGETVRRAGIGETLGQTNASEERTRIIPAGSYSMGLLVGFQPETALPLLEDAKAGTPQRFLWGVAVDPTIPDEPLDWPGELALGDALEAATPTPITFDQNIRRELYRERLAKVRGEATVELLDSHKPLMLVKVSALLALLHGRRHVGVEEWELARLMWEASCATRDHTLAYGERVRAREAEAQTAAHVDRELKTHRAKATADRAVERVAKRLGRLVHESGGMTRGDLRRKTAARDRGHLTDALDFAESRGWVVDTEERMVPGESRPS